VIAYGDVLFHGFLLPWLLDTGDDFVLLVDENWRATANRGREADYVHCSESFTRRAMNGRVWLRECSVALPESRIHGEWMGFMKVAPGALPRLRAAVDALAAEAGGRRAKLLHLLNRLVADGESVRVLYTSGHWLDVDSLADVLNAGDF
jgi:phosphoenolpyruvate phosphomutase